MDDSKYQIDLLTALNERLMSSEKMYRHIAECTGNLFMHFDYKSSPARVDLIGPWDETVGERIINQPYDESYMLNFLFEEDQELFRTRILEADRKCLKTDSIEVRTRNKKRWFLADVLVSYDGNDNPVEKIIQLKDISSQKSSSEELEYLAYYDSLTGVYNRNYFVKKLREVCEKADKEKTSVEVLFVDIDDFKKINDTLGLLYGDEVVQELGHCLNEFNNNDVVVGRFGSDVFVIYIYNPCGNRSADVIYRKIQERLHKAFVLSNGAEVHITVTCGVAEYPDAGRTSFEVMKNAEIILYEAKEKGNNSIQYFDPEILDNFNKNAALEKELNEAILNNNIVVYYQPEFYSDDGKIRGVELLLRWPDEVNGGFVSMPSEFINVANKNKSINSLGEIVLKEGMRNVNEWRMKYHIPFKMCINISIEQLMYDGFVENIQHTIQMYDFNPENIEIEISEKDILLATSDIINKIKTLRGLGVSIAVDNFGHDFAALKILKDINVDTVKFDKTLIDSALSSDFGEAVLQSIVELSSKLQIETIAVGAETKELFNLIRRCKCDVMQGFLTGKPAPKSEFEKVLIRQAP